MSDLEHQTDTSEFELTEDAELEALKARAKTLGVTYSHRIGVEALRKKVDAALNEDEPEEDTGSAESKDLSDLSPQARKMALRKQIQADEMKLIRCRISNLNPSKRDLRGEIFTVGNKYLGTVRKFVPYGEATDNGYHIPNVLFKALKSRKFLQVTTRTDRSNGDIIVDQRWVPEFALEVLPQLTEEELKKLAASQAAAGGVS